MKLFSKNTLILFLLILVIGLVLYNVFNRPKIQEDPSITIIKKEIEDKNKIIDSLQSIIIRKNQKLDTLQKELANERYNYSKLKKEYEKSNILLDSMSLDEQLSFFSKYISTSKSD